MIQTYNPLDKRNLGKSVADALLSQATIPFSSITPFDGAGIYSIYYKGNFPSYEEISRANEFEFIHPIYIGKAIPTGGRKGFSLNTSDKSTALYKRLIEHRDSIQEVENEDGGIRVSEFSVKFLSVDDIWIPLGESLLISQFKPLWNRLIEGFGNHDPGKGRYNGLRPLWDHLHPGRSWAMRCAKRSETIDEIKARIVKYLAEHTLTSE